MICIRADYKALNKTVALHHSKFKNYCWQEDAHFYTIEMLEETIIELSKLLLIAQKTRIKVYEQYVRS